MFELTGTRLSPSPILNAPPELELALLVDGIEEGGAWKISIREALVHPKVRQFARLSEQDTASVLATADWAQLFLTGPATLKQDFFPTIKLSTTAGDLDTFAIPIAYGLKALLELGRIFGADRKYSPENQAALKRRLSLDPGQGFQDVAEWFPQAARTGDLDGAEVDITSQQNAISVSHPINGVFDAKRVMRENGWAIAVGPFSRMKKAVARVKFIRGREKTHLVDDLPALFPGENADRKKYEKDVADIDKDLAEALARFSVANGEFFWRPTVRVQHVRAMRALESVRFVKGVSAEFNAEGVVYNAVYAPAPVTGKMGIGYTTEHRFGATAEASWSGLVRPTDTFQLKASTQDRALSGELNYRVLLWRSDDRRGYHWLAVVADAGKDENFRIGGVSSDPFTHETRQTALAYEFESRSKPSSTNRWTLKMKTTLGPETYKLTQAGITGADKDGGLLLRHEQRWSSLPLGDAKVNWESAIMQKLAYAPSVGWNSSFGLAELGASVMAKFGGELGEHERAMYISLRTSAGDSSGGVPAAYLFRFGDHDRLVGLEPGEFSGSSYIAGELLYGVNLEFALGGLFKDNKGRKNPPSALAGIDLQLLAEIGTISSREFNAFSDRHTRASSYGLSIRKDTGDGKGTGLRIGYAWSPEGRNSRGRVFTALTLGF